MGFCKNVNEHVILCSLSLHIIQFLNPFELEVNSQKPMMLLKFDNSLCHSMPNVIFLPPTAINRSCQNEVSDNICKPPSKFAENSEYSKLFGWFKYLSPLVTDPRDLIVLYLTGSGLFQLIPSLRLRKNNRNVSQ